MIDAVGRNPVEGDRIASAAAAPIRQRIGDFDWRRWVLQRLACEEIPAPRAWTLHVGSTPDFLCPIEGIAHSIDRDLDRYRHCRTYRLISEFLLATPL